MTVDVIVGVSTTDEWQHCRCRRSFDARNRTYALEKDGPEPLDGVMRPEAIHRQRDLRAEHTARVETGLYALREPQTPQQEPGADEQHERQRNLPNNERIAQPQRVLGAGRAAAPHTA